MLSRRWYVSFLAVAYLLSLGSSVAPAAEQLTYRGVFVPIKAEDGEDARKLFEVRVAVGEEKGARYCAWILTEKGRGAWPWTERFDLATKQADGAGETNLPALLFDRGDGHSIVPLGAFHLRRDEPLKKASAWNEGGLDYKVIDEARAAGIDCWQVAGSNNYGPKRRLWVAKDSNLIVGLEEKVFVGQGRECSLTWELVERKPLDGKIAAEIVPSFSALVKLREAAEWKRQTRETKWNDQQRRTLREGLPALAAQISYAPLGEIVAAARKDADAQEDRSAALATLAKEAVGKAPDKFALGGLAGAKLTSDDLKDNITVLHFWSYQDTPLEEPYGQVGYLDFLARQAANKGVKFVGVVVDDRLGETAQRGAVLASARKVKSFMNLSYPVVIDEDNLVKKIGDPRSLGAKLPLWVVIGKDGKVAHYHAGFYDVKRDEGLAELDAAIRAAKK